MVQGLGQTHIRVTEKGMTIKISHNVSMNWCFHNHGALYMYIEALNS
jgi:hypothetical protein